MKAIASHLPPIDCRPRVAAFSDRLVSEGLDAFVLTELSAIRWLTGFSGSNARVVVLPGSSPSVTLITDGRYQDQAPAEIEAVLIDASVVITRTETDEKTAAACTDAKRIGMDPTAVTWAVAESQRKAIEMRRADAELVPVPRLAAELRQRKDPAEIARMQAAAAITDAALAAICDLFRPGTTEADLAAELDAAMRARGASAPAFETIVASGPNGALPHHRPSARQFVSGDLVVVDVGAIVDGYRSDMTRTVAIGTPPAELTAVWELVVAAQQAGVTAATADAPIVAVDKACRDMIEAAGYGKEFMHGTGHGVGLDIHEEPFISTKSTGRLGAGMVITVEPGVYLPADGGVRIEDTVVVGNDGAQRLTGAPKSLDPAGLAR